MKLLFSTSISIAVAGFVSGLSGSVLMNLDFEFSGTAPAGTAPWVILDFVDAGDDVELTITNPGLVGWEKVSQVYFNFVNDTDLDALSFTIDSVVGTVFGLCDIDVEKDAYKADGDGRYDILFSFPSSGNTFGASDSVVVTIASGLGNIDPIDFIALSKPEGGHGPFYAAAHVQSIGCGENSGWIAPSETPIDVIPEPSTLFGLIGLISLGLIRRRK